jgi:hypothetical protein
MSDRLYVLNHNLEMFYTLSNLWTKKYLKLDLFQFPLQNVSPTHQGMTGSGNSCTLNETKHLPQKKKKPVVTAHPTQFLNDPAESVNLTILLKKLMNQCP